MGKLPLIFDHVRFKLPEARRPNVVINMQRDPFDIVNEWLDAADDEHYTLEISFWRRFWLEIPYRDSAKKAYGMLCEVLSEDLQNFESMRVTVYNSSYENRGQFMVGEYFAKLIDESDPIAVAYSGLCSSLSYTLHYLNVRERYEKGSDDSIASAQRKNKVEYHAQAGDTIRYIRVNTDEVRKARIQARTKHTQPEVVEVADKEGPGHHKRQHDVAGHWRTYKSGKRVFVRAHQRGDPALGTVIRVYNVDKPHKVE